MQKEIRYFVIFIGTSLVFFLSIVAIFLCTFNSTYGLFISFILIQPVFVTVGSSLNIKPPVSWLISWLSCGLPLIIKFNMDIGFRPRESQAKILILVIS